MSSVGRRDRTSKSLAQGLSFRAIPVVEMSVLAWLEPRLKDGADNEVETELTADRRQGLALLVVCKQEMSYSQSINLLPIITSILKTSKVRHSSTTSIARSA